MNAFRLRRSGIALHELTIVIGIVAVLVMVLLKSVQSYQAQAERAAAQQVIVVLRSALQLQVVMLIAQGRQAEFAALAMQNPMDLLARKPDNYQGEFDAPLAGVIAPGKWYFDRSDRKLIYFYNTQHSLSDIYKNQLSLKMKLVSIRSNSDQKQNDGDMISGVSLEQLPP